MRIEAARALRDLRTCTNTTPVLTTGLHDTNAYVRVWTCDALIGIAHDYSEPLDPRVIPTLGQCLALDTEEEPTWIAAWIAGRLGNRGSPLIPDLKKLAGHKSSKVRDYAHEALGKIRHQKKTTE